MSLGATGSFDLSPGKIHADVVKVKATESAPLCEIKYDIQVVKDGAPYDTAFFIVKITG